MITWSYIFNMYPSWVGTYLLWFIFALNLLLLKFWLLCSWEVLINLLSFLVMGSLTCDVWLMLLLIMNKCQKVFSSLGHLLERKKYKRWTIKRLLMIHIEFSCRLYSGAKVRQNMKVAEACAEPTHPLCLGHREENNLSNTVFPFLSLSLSHTLTMWYGTTLLTADLFLFSQHLMWEL